MRKLLPLLVAAGFIACGFNAGSAQAPKEKSKYDPPGKTFPPNADVLQQIETKTAQLAAKIAELRKNEKTHDLLPDVEIYLRGAQNIVRFKEWYSKDSGKWTLDCLDRGLLRADQLAKGEKPWTTLQKRNVVRGYRSAIDGTAQLYGVTYPLDYGKDPKRKWRVDVVLHGRDGALTEVRYLYANNGNKKVSPDHDWVQLDIFGRGNNAYRWAGETDVLQAEAAYRHGEFLAKRDVHFDMEFFVNKELAPVLRGFSMGGAGAWHLGLRHPTLWSVMGPGAGFTTTHNYAWKGKKELPDYQEKCLRIYDAIDYAENARMIPIVAYSGGDDPQKLAADNIEKRLRELNIKSMTHLVKPGVGHKFEADYFKKANALWSKYAAEGRERFPTYLSFVTYSTKASSCAWIQVMAMEKQYQKATVEGDLSFPAVIAGKKMSSDWRCHLTTKNVRLLGVNAGFRKFELIEIDGQVFKNVEPEIFRSIFLAKIDGKWTLAKDDEIQAELKKGRTKFASLQGPIDDAFASGFLCVTGTGETWHPATQKFVDAKIKAFEYDWAKHWRGELPITNEYGITPNEIMDKHLILFGDPSSNFLLANILPKLPLKWTKDEIEFAGKKYKSSDHVPVMIFPNPLNPRKYVVLNTGHTFPSEDYNKTNALLYPRLGDYAILRMTPTAKNAAAYEVATAGLFDEFWRVEKK